MQADGRVRSGTSTPRRGVSKESPKSASLPLSLVFLSLYLCNPFNEWVDYSTHIYSFKNFDLAVTEQL